MLLDILQHTPAWVFAVFVALVVLGVSRLRTREVGVRRLVLLPAGMTGFSLFGLAGTFGLHGLTLAAWTVAFAAMLVAGWTLSARSSGQHRVQYSSDTRTIRVPGSWVPLALMMTIFFLRYAVAVVLAIHPSLKVDPSFASAVAAAYGLSSGCFATRALMTWRSAFRPRAIATDLAAA